MNTFRQIFGRLKEHLNIVPDKEDEQTVIDNVRRAVEFRGANLWILVFAVFIASIGLNIDSTPIIIGAMLISPLMGPIIGTGLAVGINDMELMKRSLRNLFTASLFAVAAATLYFWCSPLNEAKSELLARTSPTLYDVAIAIAGGSAGFLALSTTGNHIQVIVGVAISTALLPPLCTVGFGIASGNWIYALGALYLFFINSVFIAISTFLSVRIFRFSPKVFSDKAHEMRVRKSLVIISLITLLPSVILTYNIVRKTIYTQNAERFITQELNFPGTKIINKSIDYNSHSIQTIFIGRYIPEILIENAKRELPRYHLKNTTLTLLQDSESRDSVMLNSLSDGITHELWKMSEQHITLLQSKIDSLKSRLAYTERFEQLDSLIYGEANIIFPYITAISIGNLWDMRADYNSPQMRVFAHISLSRDITNKEEDVISQWLKHRINSPDADIKFSF